MLATSEILMCRTSAGKSVCSKAFHAFRNDTVGSIGLYLYGHRTKDLAVCASDHYAYTVN